jgi:integrase/recombinase XerD
MTIQHAIKAYLVHCETEKNLNIKSIQAYQIDLNQFLSFTIEMSTHSITEIDRNILRSYFLKLSSLKPRTIRRKMTCLKSFFNYLEFDDLIEINPFRKMQLKYKMPTYIPTVMNKAEVENILKSAYSYRSSIKNTGSYAYAEATRAIAILELLFATGIRVSELCNLKKNDVDLMTGYILIMGKGSKQRFVQIVAPETKLILEEYHRLFATLIDKEGFFYINRFGNCISSQSVRYMVKKFVNLALIDKKITPHTFRHTFATLLLEADVDLKYIQHFLGHSSIMTTQIYTHVNRQKQQEILLDKHPRLSFKMSADSVLE